MTGKSTSVSQAVPLKQGQVFEVRSRILEEQEGKCPICDRDIKDPCLDHSHIKRTKGTGLVRGVLCRACNVLVAKMENNCVRYGVDQSSLPRVLRNMASYLEKDQYQLIHPSELPSPPKLKKSSYNKLKKSWPGKGKAPDYPKSGRLTKQLDLMFKKAGIEPEFYK